MATIKDNSEIYTNERVQSEYYAYNTPSYLDVAVNGGAFIFVTKPSLFIYPQKPSNTSNYLQTAAYNNMCTDPIFSQYILSECKNSKDRYTIKQLSYEEFSDIGSYFMPIFTNLTNNADLVDITLDSMSLYGTRSGYFLNMPGKKSKSETAASLSLNVTETYNNDFTKMITLWVNYINNVVEGIFTANPVSVRDNVLDYTSAIYVFLLGADGSTIKNYCKYTGCYPSSIPLSSNNASRGSFTQTQLGLNFNYAMFEANNPRILEDFNAISLKLISSAPIRDYKLSTSGDELFKEYAYGTAGVDYDSFRQSALLNKNQLLNSRFRAIVNSDKRDPLVFAKETNNGNYDYVLSFGKESFENTETKSTIGDDIRSFYTMDDDD